MQASMDAAFNLDWRKLNHKWC